MTEYTQTAHEICAALDTTPGATERAREHAQKRRDRLDNWSAEQTTLQLPTGDRIHKHQLVVDTDDDTHYMIKQLAGDRISVVEVYEPTGTDDIAAGAGPVGFGDSYWLTIGDFLSVGDPQYATDGSPVWAY